MLKSLWSIAVLAGIACATQAQAYEKPGFPRLGGYNIGSPHNYEDPAYQTQLAKLDLIILNNYPGWESSRKTTMQSVVQAIKQKNSRALVFTYVINNEVPDNGAAWDEVRQKLDKQNWWLYPQGLLGLKVTSTWQGASITNYTLSVTPDFSGSRFVDWFARWSHQKFFQNTPALDGTFTDNFFWKPRVNGDWNVDGIADSVSNASVQTLHRQGMRRHIEVLRELMPGKYQLGNIGGWGEAIATYPEYEGLLNGGVLEHYIGKSWSPEGMDWQGNLNSWGSWNELMLRYRKVMKSVNEPKLVVFNQLGDPRNYQAFRYGLASCLMDDAYYQFSDATGPGIYSTVPWFDEYDVDLGRAISAPPTKAWKSGVYRRDFENGIVLVNPRGNGAVTVSLEKEFKRIAGTQDPGVNNGMKTQQVSLKDRDGVVLLNLQPLKRPQPPRDTAVH